MYKTFGISSVIFPLSLITPRAKDPCLDERMTVSGSLVCELSERRERRVSFEKKKGKKNPQCSHLNPEAV